MTLGLVDWLAIPRGTRAKRIGALAIFGDSISEGSLSTLDANRRVNDVLSRRFNPPGRPARLAVGLAFSRRASASAEQFFLSGRALPWWLAGTSMVATTFAADTPLAVTGLTVKYGIAGNWLWWSFVMSGMLTVVFYARLWRRAEILTDAEFAEIRYSGRAAAFLRGFRACYLALAVNSIIIGWVTAAMGKILGLTLGLGRWEATIALFNM